MLSGGLDVFYVERLGLLLPLLVGHDPFVLQVRFVADEYHWEGRTLFDSENRLAKFGNFFETVSVYDGIDQ